MNVITKESAPYTQSAQRDNREFDNGQGVPNRAFGVPVRSRSHLRELETAYGVTRVEKTDEDFQNEMHSKPTPKKRSVETMKKYRAIAEAEVAKGWEPTPVPDKTPVDKKLKKELQKITQKEHPRIAKVDNV